MDNMDNTNYVNVNPLPDEVGGVNCETKTGNTEEIREPAVNVEGNEASDTSTESPMPCPKIDKFHHFSRHVCKKSPVEMPRRHSTGVFFKIYCIRAAQ